MVGAAPCPATNCISCAIWASCVACAACAVLASISTTATMSSRAVAAPPGTAPTSGVAGGGVAGPSTGATCAAAGAGAAAGVGVGVGVGVPGGAPACATAGAGAAVGVGTAAGVGAAAAAGVGVRSSACSSSASATAGAPVADMSARPRGRSPYGCDMHRCDRGWQSCSRCRSRACVINVQAHHVTHVSDRYASLRRVPPPSTVWHCVSSPHPTGMPPAYVPVLLTQQPHIVRCERASSGRRCTASPKPPPSAYIPAQVLTTPPHGLRRTYTSPHPLAHTLTHTHTF